MKITEVRIKLMEDSDDRLQAFCSITFDDSFVVRDLKIIEGSSGPFVAMPSRKLTSHCGSCGSKNHLRASYCNNCGAAVKEDHMHRDAEGRSKLYADIAHPINSECREMIQNRVIAEFETEIQASSEPGYVSRYDDEYSHEENAARAASKPTKSERSPASEGGITSIQPPQPGPAPPHMPSPQASDNKPSARRRGHRPNTSSEKSEKADKPGQDESDSFGEGIF